MPTPVPIAPLPSTSPSISTSSSTPSSTTFTTSSSSTPSLPSASSHIPHTSLPPSQTLYLTLLHRRSPAQPFIYAVITTKIYCIPGCPSRLARRSNIQFYTLPSLASAAGFRPCKRCKPDECFERLAGAKAAAPDEVDSQAGCGAEGGGNFGELGGGRTGQGDVELVLPARRRQGEAVAKACALLREKKRVGRKVAVGEVAREVGLTKWHFGRVFRRLMGVGPGEWARRLDVGGDEEGFGGDGGIDVGWNREVEMGEMLQPNGGEDMGDSLWWEEVIDDGFMLKDGLEMPGFGGMITPEMEDFDWDQFIDVEQHDFTLGPSVIDTDGFSSIEY